MAEVDEECLIKHFILFLLVSSLLPTYVESVNMSDMVSYQYFYSDSIRPNSTFSYATSFLYFVALCVVVILQVRIEMDNAYFGDRNRILDCIYRCFAAGQPNSAESHVVYKLSIVRVGAFLSLLAFLVFVSFSASPKHLLIPEGLLGLNVIMSVLLPFLLIKHHDGMRKLALSKIKSLHLTLLHAV